MVARTVELDRVLADHELVTTHAAVRAVGGYAMFTSKSMADCFAAGLVPRHDAAREFLRTGGISGFAVDLRTLADRVNFFRATLAYGSRVEQPGIEAYLRSSQLADAAREVYGCAFVEPVIIYVNLALPGQEIGLHTDVPEFRGLDRDRVPEWLLVVMHHCGLFADYRIAIATGVSWFGSARGGAFVYWPAGPEGPARTLEIADNRGVVLDTDSVFHAVAPVEWTCGRARPTVEVGARMRWDERRDAWIVSFQGAELAALAAADVRVSISWKARCFASEAERERARTGADPLALDEVLTRLRRDLADRGRLPSAEASISQTELAVLMIDEYVRFPSPPR